MPLSTNSRAAYEDVPELKCTGSSNGLDPRPLLLFIMLDTPGLNRATAATSPYFRRAAANAMVHENAACGTRFDAAGVCLVQAIMSLSGSSSVLIHVEESCNSNGWNASRHLLLLKRIRPNSDDYRAQLRSSLRSG